MDQVISRADVETWMTQATGDGCAKEHLYSVGDPYYDLQKEGFVVRVDCRDYPKALDLARRNKAGICGWGPDGLCVIVPVPYSLDGLKENLKRCTFCFDLVDEVVRISFAGRACKPCRKKNVDRLEYPGWTN